MENKHERYEKAEYYRGRAGDMEGLAIISFIVGWFFSVPVLIVLHDLIGLSDESSKSWMYVVFVPSLVCSFRWVYFSFRAWLANPYKNI